jgi:hypothetical protein
MFLLRKALAEPQREYGDLSSDGTDTFATRVTVNVQVLALTSDGRGCNPRME